MKSIIQKLENFELENLNMFEKLQYNDFSKNFTKAGALQILINNVEGDFSQLSDELREIAEEQSEMNERPEIENLIIEKANLLCKNASMDFPDYDEENPFTNLADALTVIVWDTLQLDCDSSEIYDFLQSKFKK